MCIYVSTITIFTWLNAIAFITLVRKIDVATIQAQYYYLILEDVVYTHNFEISCSTDEVRLLFKVWRLIK